MKIPLIPLPSAKALAIARKLRPLAKLLKKFSPGLAKNLYQAEIDVDPASWLSLSLFAGIFYGLLVGSLATLFIFAATRSLSPIGPLVGLVFFFLPIFYLLMWPKLRATRRMKELERDLLFAMRHLLIEIRSGISLFRSMVGISKGYGEISDEFRRVVDDINAGASEMESLNEVAERNPSLYFRRAIWQIINALKAGADVSKAIEAITDDLAQRQSLAIKKYGQELNPYAMIYMIVAVIAPSIGLTFIVILTSFIGTSIPTLIFPGILAGLALFQLFFLSIVRTKRPALAI